MALRFICESVLAQWSRCRHRLLLSERAQFAESKMTHTVTPSSTQTAGPRTRFGRSAFSRANPIPPKSASTRPSGVSHTFESLTSPQVSTQRPSTAPPAAREIARVGLRRARDTNPQRISGAPRSASAMEGHPLPARHSPASLAACFATMSAELAKAQREYCPPMT